MSLLAVVAVALIGCSKGTEGTGSASTATAEHAGQPAEHAGQPAEHAGQPAEHAGQPAEHAGGPAKAAGGPAKAASAEQIKSALQAHLAAESQNGGGVFRFTDDKTGDHLELELVRIHEPRSIDDAHYFACTDFHPRGEEAGKLWDLDFWIDVEGDELRVTKARVHKQPKKQGDAWVKEARYTFVDNQPVEVE